MATRSQTVRRMALSFCCLLFVSGTVWGQTALSTIRGTVSDESNSLVPGVQITLRDVNTNVVARTVISDDSGNYEIPDLKIGTYRLEAELPGFRTFVAENIVLEGSQIRRIDVVLQVGELTDQVTVEAGAAVITTDSAEISSGFTEERFDSSPLVRTYYPQSLMITLPGIDTQMGSWSLRMAGQPREQVAEGMDGVTEDGTVNLINNMMDFTELKVVAVNATADSARVANFNMVSKRGSNEFHGSAFYSHFNSALNARYFFEPEKTVTIEHKAHVDVSGPIIKDRTFFYAAYFHQRLPAGSFNRSTVPTLLMRQGDFSQVSKTILDPLTGQPFPNNIIPQNRLNPMALKVQDLYIPEPNLGGAGALVNNLGFEHAYPDDLFRADYPMVRIDHNITDNNTIYGRYIRRYTPYVLKRGLPGFDRTRVRWHRGFVLSDTHVFSPTLVNTARFGWLWDFVEDGSAVDGFTPRTGDEVVQAIGLQGVNPSNLSAAGFPRMDITGFTSLETSPGGVAEDNHQFNFAESLSWTTGDHVFKFGGELKRISDFDGRIDGNTYGRFTFDGSMTGYSYADFLLGLPFRSRRVDPLVGRTQRAHELGIYIRDTFKVTPKLTLDYGLRWDYFPSAVYEDGLQYNGDPETGNVIVSQDALSEISPLYPGNINIVAGDPVPEADLGNFRPRLGLAYRLTDQTVLRGGYGAFTEQIGYFERVFSGGPFEIAENYTNDIIDGQPFFAFPNPFPADLASSRVPSQDIEGYPTQTDNGTIHQFNVSLEHQIRDIGFRTSYIGSRSRGLNYNLNINKPAPSLIPFSADRRPYPQFVDTDFARSNGATNYDAFQFEVQRKAGWATFNAHYTLQNSMANFLNLENPYNANLWNRQQYDARHKFVINTMIDLPWGRGRKFLSDLHPVLDHIIGGWRMTTVSYFKSGQYFTPEFDGSDPSNTDTSGGLPDRIADGNLPSDQRTIERWFDPSAFVEPAPGRFGNSGVNILEGPGVNVHHLNLTKRFSIREGLSLDYVAGISNLFNHPHFRFPRENISASRAGQITRARNANQDQEKVGQRMIEMTLRLRW
ncbi:MAG: TonB-dependent receptor domain-containing protein [Acidobacteriota bacterium]